MNLPSAATVGPGFIVSFRKTDDLSVNAYGSQVQIVPSSTSERIGGFYNYILTVIGEGLTIVSDGTNWQIVSQVDSGRQTLTYTSAGTYYWTCPYDVRRVQASLWGSGGSTNNAGSAPSAGGSGFTDGAYTVVPGTTYTITIGTGALYPTTTGTNSTIVFGATTITASGGSLGAAGTGTNGALNFTGGVGPDFGGLVGTAGASAGFSGNATDWTGSGNYAAPIGAGFEPATSVRLYSFQREGASGSSWTGSFNYPAGFPGGAGLGQNPSRGSSGAAILSW